MSDDVPVLTAGAVDPADTGSTFPDPFALAARWLPEPDSGVTPLLTLSTIGLDGYPAARTVLLSRFDGRRVHFHTDRASTKAAELAATPRAAVTIVWPELARQLVLTGDVTTVTDQEARVAYAARTRYLQVLAWLNDHNLAARGPAERRARWAAFSDERGDDELEPPPGWVGYAIEPVRLAFWSGATDAPSTRLLYERVTDGRWTVRRRAG
ncbi:pyridoxal 5'-phosphate synthase [Curtobacterium sp. MCBA15_001]|uniref:pyridoxine/pyridoxamine 5'-phosphate oxidase n=1 Tax=Curtobacterium sp. MCBA15_001 TaxID=1898731 RepID=UPI000A54C661|nr:pyridoxamine 5'-phosphate oxidase family protein [Curtobacterium sp. MCBA15_001]